MLNSFSSEPKNDVIDMPSRRKTAADSFLEKLFDNRLSGIGFGLFRISFFTCLLLEVLEIARLQSIIFGAPPSVFYSFLFGAWSLTLIAIIIGYKSRIASIVNYCFVVAFIGQFSDFEYHINYTYLGVSFIAIWTPLDNRLSFRNFVEKRQPRDVPQIYYFLLVFVALVSVYFESSFHKLESEVWLRGIGMWAPSSLPQFSSRNWVGILDNELLVRAIGYTTLAFEAGFIFLFFSKKVRPILALIGIALHWGIFVYYPIPIFALAVLAAYFLMIPDHWLIKISGHTRSTRFEVSKIDTFALPTLIVSIIVLQSSALLATPIVQRSISKGSLPSKLTQIEYVTRRARVLAFGMAPHQMFLDGHFRTTNHQYALDYIGKSESDSKHDILSNLISGRIWVNWLFRVGAAEPTSEYFHETTKRYLSYWLETHSPQTNSVQFRLRMRPFKINEFRWEKGLLAKNIEVPWTSVATITTDSTLSIWQWNYEAQDNKP